MEGESLGQLPRVRVWGGHGELRNGATRLPFGWGGPAGTDRGKGTPPAPAAAGAEWGTADTETDRHRRRPRRPLRDRVVPGEWKYHRKRQDSALPNFL